MQISRNEAYVENRGRLRSRVTLLSFGLLLAAMLIPFFVRDPLVMSFIWPLFAVVLIATNASKQLQFNWGPGMLADQRLAQALKPLNNRYWFGAYVPVGGKQIVNHMLVGPEGVLVFETRNHPGETACVKGRWRRKAGILSRFFGPIPAIGDPTRDLQRQIATVEADLDLAGMMDVPVAGSVVFTAPDTVLVLEDCPVTVLTLRQLESWAQARRNQNPVEIIPDSVRVAIIEHYTKPGSGAPDAPQRAKTPVS